MSPSGLLPAAANSVERCIGLRHWCADRGDLRRVAVEVLSNNITAYRWAFGFLVALVAARVLYEGWSEALLQHAGFRRARQASERVGQRVRTGGFASLESR